MERSHLTPEQEHILWGKGTEPPFSGEHLDRKDQGMYRCVSCGNQVFASDTKFDSGSGWPSFTAPVRPESVSLAEDRSAGMVQTEVRCAQCGGHLGHVFDDGPAPTGRRYCINSRALTFEERIEGS